LETEKKNGVPTTPNSDENVMRRVVLMLMFLKLTKIKICAESSN